MPHKPILLQQEFIGLLPPSCTSGPDHHQPVEIDPFARCGVCAKIERMALRHLCLRPKTVIVKLTHDQPHLNIAIHDDGQGFEPTQVKTGMGLSNGRISSCESAAAHVSLPGAKLLGRPGLSHQEATYSK